MPHERVLGDFTLYVNQNVNLRTTQLCSVGVNKLVLTASVVPWCNPDTQTIRTQAENVAVPFGLPAWFDWALVTV